jgi:hypothetical protein
MKTVDEAIRERQAMIVELQEEVAALKRVKPILDGWKRVPPFAIGEGKPDRRLTPQPNSDASLAAKAIREAKNPLGITDIMDYLVKKGKKSNKNSVVSVLAKMSKQGKVFYRCIQPSTFGLLEWEERPDIRKSE